MCIFIYTIITDYGLRCGLRIAPDWPHKTDCRITDCNTSRLNLELLRYCGRRHYWAVDGMSETTRLMTSPLVSVLIPSRQMTSPLLLRRNDCGRRHAWTGKTPDSWIVRDCSLPMEKKKGQARRRLMDRYLCTYRIEKQCVKYTSL